MKRALAVFAGPIAQARIAEHGWDPDLFSTLLGASGGPKWLVLSQLDREIFGRFLPRRRRPLHVFGTSIGSWRHACLAQAEPAAAIERLESAYIHQSYDGRPSAREVSEVSRGILEHALGEGGVRQILDSQAIETHIGTVRGRGLLASRRPLIQGPGLALAMLGNGLNRRCLEACYQRVVFSTAPGHCELAFDDFSTAQVPLQEGNAQDALIASGSIPLILEGIENPSGAPPGQYWDGGVVDYHHDLTAYRGDGLVLYPHFFDYIVPGWFDKNKKRRHARGQALDSVVLLTLKSEFVKQLPGGAIPDRRDFQTLSNEARIERWWQVTERCRALVEDWMALTEQKDPLEGVESFAGF